MEKQPYRKELCDLNDSKEGKILSKLLYESTFINGKIGKDPCVNYWYFKYHPSEEKKD